MKNVMKKAWEIAREGAKKFGGKASDYIAEALRMAWALIKEGTNDMIKHAEQVKGTIEQLQVNNLTGTVKQVAWAEDIRKNAVQAMFEEVLHEEYVVEGNMPMQKTKTVRRPVKEVVNALKSEESIKEYFEERKDLTTTRLENALKSLNDAYDRYQRFVEIATNDSAKFWIDNRDNQEKNYMFKNFIEYVKSGVKNF